MAQRYQWRTRRHAVQQGGGGRRRYVKPSLAVLGVLLGVLLPQSASADCGISDVSACVEGPIYLFWYGWSSFVWTSIDAPLLQAAYLIDVFRHWLVSVAFTSLYQVIISLVDPLIVPFAVLALIGGYILLALTPIFGHPRMMRMRHTLGWSFVVPILFVASGQLIAVTEQVRVDLSGLIFAQVSAIAPGAIFGVTADDIAPVQPLYTGDPCGTGELLRPPDSLGGGLHLDDLAAAMLWANAQDIHCPKFGGEGQDIPDAFYLDPPDGPGYASRTSVIAKSDQAERQADIANIIRGFNRLLLGILPAMLAVGESLVQLLFALALMALWVGLPFALAFVFFEESSASIAMLFKHGLAVLKTSWFCSFVLGVLAAVLRASAAQGNAGAYTALAGCAGFLMLFLIWVGLRTVWGSMQVLNTSLMAATGVNVMEPAQAVGGAARGAATFAAGAMTGGVAMAATAAAAYQQTGSGQYAAAAAAGRMRPLANVGEVAAAMGVMQNDEVLHGLYAGERSRYGGRSMRMVMERDATHTDGAGLTFRERGQERRIERQYATQQQDRVRGTSDYLGGTLESASAVVGRGVDSVRTGAVGDDVRQRRDQFTQSVGDRWQQLRAAPAAFRHELDRRGVEHPPRSELGAVVQAQTTAAAIAYDWLSPDQRYHAIRLNDNGAVQAEPPRTAAEVPAQAMRVANTQVNIPRLLRQGYTVQQNKDKTVTMWQPTRSDTTPRDIADELHELVQRQAVTQDGANTVLAGRGRMELIDDDADPTPPRPPRAPKPSRKENTHV